MTLAFQGANRQLGGVLRDAPSNLAAVLPLDLLHALFDILRRWCAIELLAALVVRQTTSWYAAPRSCFSNRSTGARRHVVAERVGVSTSWSRLSSAALTGATGRRSSVGSLHSITRDVVR